jgi:hypothetical protein
MEQAYAHALNANQVFLGLLDPAYYQLGTWYENANYDYSGFFYLYHDIVTGNNGVYGTTTGYDFCSGWGSANFWKMYLDLGYFEKVPGFSPDWIPYTPPSPVSGLSGTWTSPIMLHTTTTAVTEPTSFVHGTPYYIAVSLVNKGDTDAPPCPTSFFVDGKKVSVLTTMALPPNCWVAYGSAFAPVTFATAGTHKIQFLVNSANAMQETNTTNNLFTRTITVN